MGKVAAVMLALYAILLTALSAPVLVLAFGPNKPGTLVAGLLTSDVFLIWLGAALACEAALLFVPVRVASRRPVTRRSLLWPIAVTGLLMAGLVVGLVLAIDEFVTRGQAGATLPWAAAGAALLWAGWTLFFARLSAGQSPKDVVACQGRALLAGSVLEFLVAVPCHIVARSRGYCCAGILTFAALAFGLSVMLLSFGPAVVFLYADRWRRLHPEDGRENTAADGG